MGKPHTVPCKLHAKCGSVRMRLIPAPRGTGIVAGPAPKKLLTMAGIRDVYSSATGHTRTTGNFIKATFECLRKSYDFLTPDMWSERELGVSRYRPDSPNRLRARTDLDDSRMYPSLLSSLHAWSR